MSDNIYFAAKQATDVASMLYAKADEYTNSLESNGWNEKLRSLYVAYHGCYYSDVGTGHQITFSGEQGELTNFPVNHFRNIATHMLVMTCSNRPAMECRATNTDYKSLVQTNLANSILDYYMREKKLEVFLKQAAEYAIVYGAGFIKMDWDATRGELADYIEETKTKIHEGDIVFTNLSPFDVMYDNTKESQDHDWVLVRGWKNRFDLAAKYPELEDKILSIPTKDQSNRMRLGLSTLYDKTDDIQVLEFYHKRTECMPDGRYLMFLSSDVVLQDAAMPYRILPVFRIAPSTIHGTPHGYTPMFDLLPLQETVNTLYSTILSNQNAFGVQNVLNPRGTDIAVNQLAGGLNVIDYNAQAGKPEALNLTNTPREVFEFLQKIEQTMETLSGVNSVARGNPEASLKSGTALALVQSMALQFMSGLQQSYVELIEEVGSALVKMLQDFAHTPRLIAISGKSNRTYMKEFSSKDISNIARVVVDVGNPMAKCLAKDTPILMYDGSIKLVQNIQTNDLIMGSDSGPRTVQSVNSGKENMYEITSKDKNRNIKYGCNESHILTLKYCSDDFRYDVNKGDILDISVKDYLKLPERHKRLLQGFTTGVDFEKKNIPIPSYILGAWLGDGHSAVPALTSMDKELVKEWTNYANYLGLSIRIQENRQPNKSKVYFITSGQSHGKSDRNSFMNDLRELELIDNKHIPNIYLISSREDRLNLLAGLLDTDGSRTAETFVFTQKNKRLSDDVIYLAKSLGFRVTSKKINVNDSEYNKIVIAGDTWEIPTKIPRKQVKETEKSRNALNYGINIECKGEGTYYGFTLEEEPHFLLGDFTVTHNTTAGRVQMATELIQYGDITPKQYVNLIHTGNLDELTEDIVHENLLMRAENEDMMDGGNAIMTVTDNHKDHIEYHRRLLFDPDLRKDAELVQRVSEHIQSHIQALRTTDPDLLMLLGQQPLQPPPPPQGVAPPPGMQNGPGPQPQGPGGPGVPSPQGIMTPPEQGMIGPGVIGNHVIGPGLPQGTRIAGLPKVAPNLLPNPGIQATALNNLKK